MNELRDEHTIRRDKTSSADGGHLAAGGDVLREWCCAGFSATLGMIAGESRARHDNPNAATPQLRNERPTSNAQNPKLENS
jgi:hypothetical protein